MSARRHFPRAELRSTNSITCADSASRRAADQQPQTEDDREGRMRVQWHCYRSAKGKSSFIQISGFIHRKEIAMPKFLIEREIPGAGKLSAAELQSISQKSCSVLRSLPQVQWVESYVTDNKIYCVYIAPDEQAVREHARQGGFPANSVSIIRRMLDPTSAETPSK
jgi:hypothetical protein